MVIEHPHTMENLNVSQTSGRQIARHFIQSRFSDYGIDFSLASTLTKGYYAILKLKVIWC